MGNWAPGAPGQLWILSGAVVPALALSLAPKGLSFSAPVQPHPSVIHATTEGLGLTYQTFAGTLCCHMAGNGTWKTLGKEENILEMGVQDVISDDDSCSDDMRPSVW